MYRSHLKVVVSVLFILGSLALQAAPTTCRAIVKNVGNPRYLLELGQAVDLEVRINDTATSVAAPFIFLGRSVALDQTDAGLFFFDSGKMRIEFFPTEAVEVVSAADHSKIAFNQLAPVVRSVNQEGGTCAAYAIYNGIRQMYAMGFHGNGALVHHMANEISRGRFMVKVAMEYYGDDTHEGAESKIVQELGFNISSIDDESPRTMADYLRKISGMNWPMLLRFDIGSPMSQTPYEIFNHATATAADRRLWLPRKSDQDGGGGHQIMILKTFVDFQRREWILVVDSNWQAPRLWSIKELNSLSSARLAGWTVWQKGPNSAEVPPPPQNRFLWDDSSAESIDQPKELREPPEF